MAQRTPEQLDADVLAVINASIEEAGGGPSVDIDKITATPNSDAEPGAEGKPAADGTKPSGEAAAGDAGTKPAGSAEPELGEDGKPKGEAKPGEQAPAAKPPAKEGEAAAAAEPTDEDKAKAAAAEAKAAIEDPIPKELNERTGARMQKLIEIAKERTTETETLQKDFDDLWGLFTSSGAPAEVVAGHMELLRLARSSKAEDLTEGLKLAEALVSHLSEQLGRPKPGADPLDGFDDLKEAVRLSDMTQKAAEELATLRRQKKIGERQAQEQDQQTAAERERQKGRDALNALETELAKDPAFSKEHKQVMIGYIRSMKDDLAPAKWADAARRHWTTIKGKTPEQLRTFLGAKAATTTTTTTGKPNGDGRQRAPAGTGSRQPERGRQPAGGGSTKEPGSALEALEQGLAQVGGR